MPWPHANNISLLINLAVNSLKVRKLVIEQKNGDYNMRPTIHIILQAPPASMKTTILVQACDILKTISPYTAITSAKLLGTIDKNTTQFIPAAAWTQRNNILPIDEWDIKTRRDVVGALLALLDPGRITKGIGRWCAPMTKREKGGLHIIVKDGNIDIQTRFSMILATMHALHRTTSTDTEALISRCIPYHFMLSEEEVRHITDGFPLFKPENWDIPKEVTITKRQYKRIQDIAFASAPKRRPQLGARYLGDLCRAYALLGWNRPAFDFIMSCKKFYDSQIEIARRANAKRYSFQTE